jgi:hypothetical protein
MKEACDCSQVSRQSTTDAPREGTMSDQLPMFILQSIVIFGLVGVLFIRA